MGEQKAVADSLYITEIKIYGNRVTKDHIILRELDYRKGGKIARKGLDSLLLIERNKIFNTDLFVTTEVTARNLNLNKDSIALDISLRERWYIWPVPLIELNDRSFSEWWNNRGADLSRLNYGFFFKQRNFRGRKESLSLLVQFGFTTGVALRYTIPFIDRKQRTSLSFRLDYEENTRTRYITSNNVFVETPPSDSVFRRRFFATVNLGKRYGFYDFHTFSLLYRNQWVADTIAFLNPDYFLDGQNRQQYFQLGYSFTYDKRDFSGYPLSGHYLRFDFTKIGLGITGDINMAVFQGDLARYFSLSQQLYSSTILSFKTSLPSRQPYTEMRALGYRTLEIRGYDNYVAEGQHALTFRNTFRWEAVKSKLDISKIIPLDQFNNIPFAVYPKAYFDAGYVRNTLVTFDNERLSNKPLWGGGIGLDMVTFYNAVMRMEYSFNQYGERTFVFSYSADL